MYTKSNLIQLVRLIKPTHNADLIPYTIERITFKAPKRFKERIYKVQCQHCLFESANLLSIDQKKELSESLKLNPPKQITDSSITKCQICKNHFTDLERMFGSSQSKIQWIMNEFRWMPNRSFENRKREPLVFSLSRWESPFLNHLLWKVAESVLTDELDDLNLSRYLPIIENSLLHYFETVHPDLLKHD